MSYDRLLIWQYKGKPRATATAKLLNDTFAETWKGFASLPLALSIDDAEGKNLDLVGKHVGQSRVLTGLAPRTLFAFDGAVSGQGFARGGQGGGRWYRLGDPLTESVRLDDPDYRFLIKCRIAKNYMTGTIENLSGMLEFIFGPASAVYDLYDMDVSVLIQADAVTDFKRYAIQELDILPRPAGVGIKFYLAVPEVALGFYGAPNSAGFNNGVFARIL
ncbi:MAG: DUF2612 domain-containing protein [Burkholderiaceae bacterium]|nr:DUF2612 domain-containing protein [Burkholderiaceae bacterium]